MMFTAPDAITSKHDVSHFTNRHADLVDWLQRRALSNEHRQASRTYVTCAGSCVVGYYALAAGALEHGIAPGAVRRNMPAPVPAIVLGRLAVDTHHEGCGLGAGLLRDAVLRSMNVAQAIGARVLLCHAIDASALAFYQHHGFRQSPVADLTVMLDLSRTLAVVNTDYG